eukprot:UN10521
MLLLKFFQRLTVVGFCSSCCCFGSSSAAATGAAVSVAIGSTFIDKTAADVSISSSKSFSISSCCGFCSSSGCCCSSSSS